MMQHRSVLTWIAAAASVVFAVEARAQTLRGREFPDFTATDALTGEQFSLSDLRGKVVLVDFWATWCGPCVRELPHVKRAYSKYKARGLEIVSISLDTDKKRFERFVRDKRMTWRHVMEGGGWKTRLAREYGVRSIPRMMVIGPDGVCIDDNARGHGIDAAIRKGLEKNEDGGTTVTRDRSRPPGRDAPSERRAERREAVPLELVTAREALAGLDAPLEEVGRRIAELQAEIDRLRGELPVPRDPARAERRAARIGTGLAELRHTMFMLGLLDDASAPALPPPPAAAASRRSSAWSRLGPFLQAAEASLGPMHEVNAATDRQLAALETQIGSLEQAIAKGTVSGSVDEQIDSLVSRVKAVAEPLRAPMVTQLEVAARIIGGCCQPFDDVGMVLGSLDDRIAEVRTSLDAGPHEIQDLRALRDAFGAVCADLEEAAGLLALDEGDEALTLPENPFTGRRLKDRRVLAELAVQIGVAEQAAAALHTVVIERRASFDELHEQVLVLQGEIADRLEAKEPVGTLRQRYAEVTQEVLALHDRDGGA